MKPTGIGVVGCGNISGTYMEVLGQFRGVRVVACADIDMARAEAQARKFGVRALTVDALLADPAVEIVLNLTVPSAHAEVARAALLAGKSVYNEKPLAIERADGAALLALAAERGLRVGAAPDTFLGAGLQTCRQLLDDGAIGQPVGATAFMMGHGPEGWHPDPEFFYQHGGGPLFDMAPYYLTALIHLLGPIRRVAGAARISFPERVIGSQPKRGQRIVVQTPTHVAGLLEFAAGPIATLITSFDVWASTLPRIEVYGSEGTLLCPDPNFFDGPVQLWRTSTQAWEEAPLVAGRRDQSRGIGVAEMAAAIRGGRPHRANGQMAYHVLDAMHAILESARCGQHVVLGSTCDRPPRLDDLSDL
ncbi:MAG: Gfo/Idh/MocA family oxidoreductase [Caldilineales bacterium]|nr:Gfo/Idh/MocA family oxidoreductase [Caldilineales bacterium]MDW8317793.1 Gfo/Idh/MocA family oxidoreductase [Anaerolineae bacterium]